MGFQTRFLADLFVVATLPKSQRHNLAGGSLDYEVANLMMHAVLHNRCNLNH